MIKILSWNIRQGGGRRVARIVKAINDLDAAIIVLSEFRNNATGTFLRNQLLKIGYRYQNASTGPTNDNSVFIGSKLPGTQWHCPEADNNYYHNILRNDYEAFTLYGMYLPHKKKHTLLDFLIKQSETSKPVILAGDMNTGINYIDQKGNSFWYTDQFQKLLSQVFADAYRLHNGDTKEYSWFSHQGNGYRYDHILVSHDLVPIVKSCYYLHEWRTNGLSDHSPMVIELG